MTSLRTSLRQAAWDAAASFDLPGSVVGLEPFGNGHVNDSFRLVCEGRGRTAYAVLQRINTGIFREPVKLMENVERVTEHLRTKLASAREPDAGRRALSLFRARDGRSHVQDGEGSFWRAYRFIEGATSHDVVSSPDQARQAARAFARFTRLLADLPAPRLHETIPAFHDTRRRFDTFKAAVRTDPKGRANTAREAVDAFLSREPLADALGKALRKGELTERIAHNDTKINNVLLDDVTGEGICVVDLDTVMPGLFLYDFGDLVRTASTTAAEDERDTSKVAVDVGLFQALVRGASEGLEGEMTPFERGSLSLAGRVITYECGMRFLTDHLMGDVYFKIQRPGHNLDRARAQLALLRSLEEKDAELRAVEDVYR